MRRLPILTFVLAVSGAAIAVAATSGSGSATRVGPPAPTSFSASVAPSSGGGSSASTDAFTRVRSKAGRPAGAERAGRRSRLNLARRQTHAMLASSAARLEVRRADLRRAVANVVAREHLRLGGVRLARADLAVLCDRLAAGLAHELGRSKGQVLWAARAELATGLGSGIVSAHGVQPALACFGEPTACDVNALLREQRAGRRTGR